MPFYKTQEPTRAFFDLFLKNTTDKEIPKDNRLHPMLPVELQNETIQDFLVRYYKRSGKDATEDLVEHYPCIVIQDFQPELNKMHLWGRDFLEGAIDIASGTREKIYFPIPLTYRYQVSVITERFNHVQSCMDWFLREYNFYRPDIFTFNKIETEEGFAGDVVKYMATFGEVPREDRYFEYVFNFDMDIYLHARAKKYTVDSEGAIVGGRFEDMITSIKLSLKRKDISTLMNVVSSEFDLSGIETISLD